MTEHKLMAITECRRKLSDRFTEQVMGLRDDVNEQSELLMSALYDAGASRAAELLAKYAPRNHGLSHEKKCPACSAWWPRHNADCEIGELL